MVLSIFTSFKLVLTTYQLINLISILLSDASNEYLLMSSRRKRICEGSISIRTTVYLQTFSPSFYWILGVFVVIIVMSDALSNTASSTTSPLSARNRHHKERWLVVDFDGTCTIRDTTPLLPRLAYFIESRSRHSACVDCEEEELSLIHI